MVRKVIVRGTGAHNKTILGLLDHPKSILAPQLALYVLKLGSMMEQQVDEML